MEDRIHHDFQSFDKSLRIEASYWLFLVARTELEGIELHGALEELPNYLRGVDLLRGLAN